jgi:UDP-2-acetamido-3-amino-2,3-dideoxy-glucuronate N-acetyltransferase
MSEYTAHPSAVIDDGVIIGKGSRIWHFSHLMPGCVVGENCNIGQNVSLYTGVICEDDVFLGPSCVFTNVMNPRSAVVRKNEYRKTTVRRGASIGANATIVCGNDIGEYAFIGAGAVVTKEVPAFALVVGNPARQKGWMSKFGHKLTFDKIGLAVCPEAGDTYQLENGRVSAL